MKPFVKWAGGKAWALSKEKIVFPKDVHNYYEPFLGGGAFLINELIHNNFNEYYANDLNSELINCWKYIKNDVHGFCCKLKALQINYNSMSYDERGLFYYNKRKEYNETHAPELLIFLNKLCFNGLYRVNKKNEFNVPWTKYKKDVKLYDRENLIMLSNALQKVKFTDTSFLNIKVKPNSFVLLDPPYERAFSGYTSNEFKLLDSLVEYIKELDKRQIKFLLFNSFNDITLEAFKDFNLDKIQAPRRISCKAKERDPVYELLVKNY